MGDLTLRSVKGTPLTNAEVDNNFVSLEIAKLDKTLRLAEFDTPEAKQQARANLELDIIDGGTFN